MASWFGKRARTGLNTTRGAGDKAAAASDALQASDAPAAPDRATSRRPLMLALEPRMMFDASVAIVADAAVDATHAAASATPDATAHADDSHIADAKPTDVASQTDHPADAAPATSAAVTSTATLISHAPDGLLLGQSGAGAAVVVIDASVSNADALVAALPTGTEVIRLNANSNGLDQLADALAGHSNLGSIQIVSEGSSGALRLGNGLVDQTALDAHATSLARIGAALASDGDILLYGCKAADGSTGRAFVDDFARLTGADVAASIDWTGAASLDGNWTLEYASGDINHGQLLDAASAASYDHLLTTLVAGDIAVIGWGAANGTFHQGNITIAALVDVAAGTTIKLTDIGWMTGSVSGAAAGFPSNLNSSEGRITWTLGSTLQAGDIVRITIYDGYTGTSGGSVANAGTTVIYNVTDGTTISGSEYSRSGWAGTGASSSVFRSIGDSVLIYQGADTSPTFVFGVNVSEIDPTIFPGANYLSTDGSGWNPDANPNPAGLAVENMSALPTTGVGTTQGLVNGISAVGFPLGTYGATPYNNNNFQYTGPTTTASRDTWLARFGNKTNWTGVDTGGGTSIGNVAATNSFASTTGTVVPLLSGNSAPSLTLDSGSASYTENASATVVSSGATASDADANWNGGSVALTLSANGSSADVLGIGTSGGITVAGTTVSYGGTAIGTLSAAAGSLSGSTVGSSAAASLLVTLNGSASNAAVEALVRAFTFANSSEAPSTATRTVSVVVTDAANAQSTGTRSIAVTAVNDAPVASLPASIAAYEDTATAIAPIIFSDADAGSGNVTATFGVGSGTLTASSGSGVTVTGSGTGSLALGGTVSAINSFISGSGLLFQGATNATADVTLTASIDDGGNSGSGGSRTDSRTTTIQITALNDRPVMGSGGTHLLGSGTTSDAAIGPITVASVLSSGSITDVDGPTLGIVITTSSGAGTWQYSLDGSSWTNLGTVSSTQALLLGPTASLRYVPATGTAETASLNLQGWDGSAGTNGTRTNLGTYSSGANSPFTTGGYLATASVTEPNVAPVLTPMAPTFTGIGEDDSSNSGNTVASIVGSSITDSNSSPVEGIALTGLSSGNGTWQYSVNGGSSWGAVGSVSASSALLLRATDKLRFVPDGINADSAGVTYRAWDQTGATAGQQGTKADASTTGGTTAFSSASDTASIAVSAVNDAPTLTTASFDMTGTDANTTSAAVSVADLIASAGQGDVDSGALSGIAVTGLVGNGSWQFSTDGSTWTALGSVSASSAALLTSTTQLRYTPDGTHGETASISFSAWDRTTGSASSTGAVGSGNTTTNGGTTAFSSATSIASLAVTTAAEANDAPTFWATAGSGMEILPVGSGIDIAYSTVVQPDGKILLAGYSQNSGNTDFSVVRLNTDGSLDTSFSGDGKALIPVGTGADYGYSVALQADGKIIVAGTSVNSGANDFSVVRLNADGSLDTSFSGDGKLLIPVGSGNDYGYSVAIQADGKILIAGFSAVGNGNDFSIVRLNADGSLDTSFSGDGKAIIPASASSDNGYSVALQADGKILIAGSGSNGGADVCVVRLNADGSLDTSFGGDGTVLIPVGSSNDYGYSVAVQADGKIVVAGYSVNSGATDFSVIRLNADGSLDTGFSGDGKTMIPVGSGNDLAYSVAVQADGKILVAGYSVNGSNNDFSVIRLNADGSLDTGFSGDGKALIPVGSGDDISRGITVQSDGKILIAGYSYIGSDTDFSVVRLNADGSLDTGFNGSTVNTLDGAPSYTENGAAVVLDANVQVFDTELSGANNFSGATLTLARHGGANGDDAFSATGTLGALTEGAALVVGGTTIGTVTSNSGGTLVLSFNAGATQARVNSAMQQIGYANSADAPPALAQIDWTFSDGNSGAQGSGGALAATGSTTVSITAVNDAPTISAPTSFTVTEDVAGTIAGISFGDVDAGSATMTATLGVSSGTLAADTGSGVTVSGSGSASLTLVGSVGAIDSFIAANGVSFTTAANATGDVTLAVAINDGGNTGGAALGATASSVIHVTAVNDAPTLASTTLTLAATDEDTPSTPVTVASLLASAGWADVDSGAVGGIALTGASGNGIWQYSADGSSWRDIASASTGAAVLLDATTQLRYLPDAISGETATLGFRAWDRSSGTASTNAVVSVANATITGGSSAFSSAETRASLVVAEVNHAPVLGASAGSAAFVETGGAVVVDAGIALDDANPAAPAIVSATVGIGAGFTAGSDVLGFVNDGATMGDIAAHYDATTGVLALGSAGGATLAEWQAALRGVSFDNGSALPATATRAISFVVTDALGASSNAATRSLTVTGVDQPARFVALDAAPVTTENGAAVVLDADARIADPESAEADDYAGAQLVLVNHAGANADDRYSASGSLGALTEGAALTVDGVSVGTVTRNSGGVLMLDFAIGGTATQARVNAVLSQIAYANAADAPPASARIDWQFTPADSSADAIASGSTTVGITPANDAPTLASTTLALGTTNEDTASTPVSVASLLASAGVADADGATTGHGIAITSAGGNGGWEYSTDGAAWFALGSVASDAALLLGPDAQLRYVPDGIAGETARLGFAAWDASAGSATVGASRSVLAADTRGGSTSLSAALATATLAVTDVNDAPTIVAPALFSAAEDGSVALTGIVFSDVDARAGTVTASFGVSAGSLVASSGTGVVVGGDARALTLAGTLDAVNAFIAAGSLRYVGVADGNGRVPLSVAIDDGGHTGAVPDPAPGPTTAPGIAIEIAPVNDAPTLDAPAAAQVGEGLAVIFGSATGNAIALGDIDAGSAPLRLTLGADHGSLALAGSSGIRVISGGNGAATLVVEGSAADLAAALDGLRFTPTAGYHGAATINLTVDDLGNSGSGSGGALVATDAIAVTVNAAPRVADVVRVGGATGYKAGDTVLLRVDFDMAVLLDSSAGAPTLTLALDGGTREASFVSADGRSLTFAYVVQAGDATSDLQLASGAALALHGATLRNAGGSAAVLDLPALAGGGALLVDGVAPRALRIVNAIAWPTNADSLDFTVTFSEPVSGVDAGDFAVRGTGSATGRVTAVTAIDAQTWRVTVASSGDGTIALALDLAGSGAGTGIADAVGNPLARGLAGVPISVDHSLPTVEEIALVSTAAPDATTLSYRLRFSEPVVGLDAGLLALTTTGSAAGRISELTRVDARTWIVTIDALAGNGTVALTVPAGDGSITDTVGNALATTATGPAFAHAEAPTMAPAPAPTPAPAPAADAAPAPAPEVAPDTGTPAGESGVQTGRARTSMAPARAGSVNAGAEPFAPVAANAAPVATPVRAPADGAAVSVVSYLPRAMDSRPTVEHRQLVIPGQEMKFGLPPGTFSVRDANSHITYSARLVNGKPWPAWLRFDERDAKFSGTAPKDGVSQLVIEVRMTDERGSSVVTELTLNFAPPPPARTAFSNQLDGHGDAAFARELAALLGGAWFDA